MSKENRYGNITPDQGALMDALIDRDYEKAKRMIKRGVDPNFITSNLLAKSPIYVVGENEDLDMLNWLIDEGKAKIDQEIASYMALTGNFSTSLLISKRLKLKKVTV